MYSFATSGAGGLGMTAAEFWASTPREFAARRKVFEQGREFDLRLYAGLQATLHNAHFRTERSQPVFTPEMFLPNYAPEPRHAARPGSADESWRTFKRQAQRAGRSPAERARLEANAREFADRQRRASAAQARGATGREVVLIMEGTVN